MMGTVKAVSLSKSTHVIYVYIWNGCLVHCLVFIQHPFKTNMKTISLKTIESSKHSLQKGLSYTITFINVMFLCSKFPEFEVYFSLETWPPVSVWNRYQYIDPIARAHNQGLLTYFYKTKYDHLNRYGHVFVWWLHQGWISCGRDTKKEDLDLLYIFSAWHSSIALQFSLLYIVLDYHSIDNFLRNCSRQRSKYSVTTIFTTNRASINQNKKNKDEEYR